MLLFCPHSSGRPRLRCANHPHVQAVIRWLLTSFTPAFPHVWVEVSSCPLFWSMSSLITFRSFLWFCPRPASAASCLRDTSLPCLVFDWGLREDVFCISPKKAIHLIRLSPPTEALALLSGIQGQDHANLSRLSSLLQVPYFQTWSDIH